MHPFHGQLLSGLLAGLCVVSSLYAGETAVPSVASSSPPSATPAGTLYLVAPVSVRMPGGVIGFEPGQAVRLVCTDAKTGRLLVSDGKYRVEVAPAQVTTNASVAAPLRQQEEANRRAIKAAQDAQMLAQKRHEAALKRIEINRDVELAKHVPADVSMKQTRVYDRAYGLRGEPYTDAHENVPRVQGPHSIPGSLGFKTNDSATGFY